MAPKYKHLFSSTLNFLSCLPSSEAKGLTQNEWTQQSLCLHPNKRWRKSHSWADRLHLKHILPHSEMSISRLLSSPQISRVPSPLNYLMTWLQLYWKMKSIKDDLKKKKLFHFKPLEVLNHLFLPTSSYRRYISHLGSSEDTHCLKEGCCKQKSWFLCFSVIL